MTSRPKLYEFRQHPHSISFSQVLLKRGIIKTGIISIFSRYTKNVGMSFKRRKRTHLLRRYSHYSVSSTSQAAFFIGGYDGGSYLSIIAKYENDKWSLHGNLKRSRVAHASITYGTATIVIGGGTNDGS